MGNELEVLGRVPIFEGLSDRELRRVLKETSHESFAKDATIVEEGSPGGRFYLILEGLAKVVVGSRKRATLGPGDFFGEMSLIDKQPRSATIRAETNVKAISLASWNFLSLLEEHPSMARKVMVGLSSRIRVLDKSLAD